MSWEPLFEETDDMVNNFFFIKKPWIATYKMIQITILWIKHLRSWAELGSISSEIWSKGWVTALPAAPSLAE